jgi:glycosyltransferase involved in cell wall biosynthesis
MGEEVMSKDSDSDLKLTIAHIMPWSGIGGVEIATLRMVDVLREQFRQVAFCLPDATVRGLFEKAGIETITYSPPVPSLRHASRFYRESLALARQLRAAGADIVHFSEVNAAVQGSLAAFLAGSRIICHVRNTYPHMTVFRQRLPLLLVHRFIFVSGEAKRHFALPLPDNKARVIYDAIELPDADVAACNSAVRRELGIPTQCAIVGMVARVNPQKDYFTLASAAAKVVSKYPDTRFLIVGDNSLVDLNRQHYTEVIQKLNELGIAENFVFTGHRDDVTRLIAAMDISVLSTHREGFGLCIAESMAMRKPVVATAVGGLLEVVQHGVTGYLHEHENSQELADMILSLIENPKESKRLGEAGHEHVRQNYSRKAFADDLSGAYSDLMRK